MLAQRIRAHFGCQCTSRINETDWLCGALQGLPDNQPKSQIGIEKLEPGFSQATISAGRVDNSLWLNLFYKGINFRIGCAASNIERRI